jgi:DNA-binding transcriptional regulator YiaG
MPQGQDATLIFWKTLPMEQLKNLRKQLGLSQADFADLLGCKEATFAMAESGLRHLPAASLQVASLLLATPQHKVQLQVQTKVKDWFTDLELKWLSKAIFIRKIKLQKVELQIEALDIKIQQASNLMQFAANLQSSGQPLNELTALKLEVLRRKALEKHSHYRQKWLALQLNMTGLQAEIEKAATL